MKKFLVYFLVSLLALGSLNAYAGKKTQNKANKQEQSKNQPTKEETVKFIIETINANHSSPSCSTEGCEQSFRFGEQYFNANFQDGVLSYCSDSISPLGLAREQECTETTFKVSELVPKANTGSIVSSESNWDKTPRYMVILYCSSGACFKDGSSNKDEIKLIFDKKETAESLAKAFNHLIKLSGGKEKLF